MGALNDLVNATAVQHIFLIFLLQNCRREREGQHEAPQTGLLERFYHQEPALRSFKKSQGTSGASNSEAVKQHCAYDSHRLKHPYCPGSRAHSAIY